MRSILIALLLIVPFFAAADCELFKEEVKVVSEEIREMYADLHKANKFVETAKSNRTETDNQKLGRYLEDIKKDLDRIEHAMSQLKLHQDCACENFKFQYVDNLLVEIKFWLKKARDIDRAKPKKTNYDGLKSNTDKALAKASNLQVYFIDPCKGQEEQAEPEATEAVAEAAPVDSSQTEEAPSEEVVDAIEEPIAAVASSDTSAVEEKTEELVETPEQEETPVIAEAAPADTSSSQGTEEPVTTSDEPEAAEGQAEESKSKASTMEDGASATGDAAGAAAGTGTSGSSTAGVAAAVGAGVVGAAAGTAAIVASGDKDSTQAESTEAVSDSSATEEEDIFADDESASDSTMAAELELGEDGAITGVAVVAVPLPQDSTSEADTSVVPVEEELIEPASAAVVMDTVRHMDTSTPVEEEEVAEVTPPVEEAKAEETIPEEKVDVPSPAPKAVAVVPVAAPIPEDFHYAVQIATGNANTSEGKYAALNEDIYMVEEGGLNKYRIGRYKNLSEARAAKNKAFNGGFLDAFVVAYSGGKRISITDAKNIEKGAGPSSSNTASATTPPPPVTKKEKPTKIKRNAEVVLAIQIGANLTSTDPVYEIVKYERMVGMEVGVLHGSPVRFYTSATTDRMEVERNLGKVKSAGIAEAFLIGVADGKRIDYQEALDFLTK